MNKAAWILAIAIVGAMDSSAAPTTKTWHFDVFLDNKLIGDHRFAVTDKAQEKHVQINANFSVKFLFLTAYQYRHSNEEVWKNQCLLSIKSHTEDNGTSYQLDGKLTGRRFQLDVNNDRKFLDQCVQSFSYWDSDILNRNYLLNSQTGEYQSIDVENLGQQEITIGNQAVTAKHYRLNTDDFAIELWYSGTNDWLSLRSTTKSGKVLSYRLRETTP